MTTKRETYYDDLGVRVVDVTIDGEPVRGVDAGLADVLERVNAAGYRSVQSMSGLRADYERAPGRYSSDGYVAFWKRDNAPDRLDAIRAAARAVGLGVEDSACFFEPCVVVRTGVCASGRTFSELREEAGAAALAALCLSPDAIEPPRPSVAFPGTLTSARPRGNAAFLEWLHRRDALERELVAANGGAIDDAEIERRWRAFADALAPRPSEHPTMEAAKRAWDVAARRANDD